MPSLNRTEKIQRIKSKYPKLYRDLKKHVPKFLKNPDDIKDYSQIIVYNALIKAYQYGIYAKYYSDLEQLTF